jgi:DNA-binding GntR family transcriptional regulator
MTTAVKHKGKLNRPNLSQLAGEEIRKGIISRKWNPGESIPEIVIAEDLGISRTPVKLALIDLSKEGLIEIIPRRGAFVRKFSTADLIDIYRIREVLEGLAARLLADRATGEIVAELQALGEHYRDTYTACATVGDERIRKADLALHKTVLNHTGSRHLQEFSGLSIIEIDSFLFIEELNTWRHFHGHMKSTLR